MAIEERQTHTMNRLYPSEYEEAKQMVKVMISYDMVEGKERECQEYLVTQVAPALNKMGVQVTDVWYTVWGDSPQILGGGEVATLEDARRIFQSDEWREIEITLEPLTENLQVKVVRPEMT
jgi:hypothetical protein